MKGDFTRSTFKRKNHYRSVRMQQGRVQLDSDWNEQVDIDNYQIETDLNDVIGRCGAPFHKKDEFKNFELKPDGKNFKIASGRYYVNGILCENDAPEGTPASGSAQPDLPPLPAGVSLTADMPFKTLPVSGGTYLACLDVWQRHVTYLDDDHIREVALGGPDTATRAKTIWQVKLLEIVNPPAELKCIDFPEFQNLVEGSTGKLSAKTTDPGALGADPCILPPGGGYRKLKNQLYRVEIHDGGDEKKATFKWSRDNGTIVVKWDSIKDNELNVIDPGRGILSCFAAGQWVELTDDIHELWGLPGTFVKLTDVRGDVLTIDPGTKTGSINKADFPGNPKIRLWDSDGIIKVKAMDEDENWVSLGDDGILVKFENGTYKTGDYWLIPARTEKATIEWPEVSGQPEAQGPHGIKHHYCRLAMLEADVNGNFTQLKDCRKLFPAITELTSIFYISGDGQEAMPGNALPEPLKVGVANGQWPVEGALVKFEIEDGGGTLTATNPVSTNPLIVETGPDGVAQCSLTVGPFPDPGSPDDPPPHQRVKATLVNDNWDEEFRLPVFFNANLSVAGQVKYFPQGCTSMSTTTTVQNAIDRLSHLANLFYMSGDGQEAMPGEPLSQMLAVIVANECGPVAGASVTFVAEGNGKVASDKIALEDSTTTNTFPATTGPDGKASCYWKPDPSGNSSQTLTATLQGAGSNPIRAPASMTFSANLSIAEEVAYFPSQECPELKDIKTVQAAIDTLCHQRGKLECCVIVKATENLEEALARIKDGDIICLLPGEHHIESISINSIKNIVLRGCCGESRLYISDKIRLEGCKDVTIEKLFISGSLILEEVDGFSLRKNIISHQADEKKLELKKCSDVLIESNQFKMRGECLIFTESKNIRIKNNSIKSSFTDAFDISIGGNKIELLDNTILSGGTGGIKIFDGSLGVVISGNHLVGGNTGVTLGNMIDGEGIKDITISGNTISGVAHYGIANLYGIYGILNIGNKSPLTGVLVENNSISDFSFDPDYLPDENSSNFRINDIIYWDGLLRVIYPGESEEKNPGRRVWDNLNQKTRDLITQWESENGEITDDLKFSVIDSFNSILSLKDFYAAEYFHGVELDDEGLELLKRGNLPIPELKRLNRLLIEASIMEYFPLIVKRFKQYGTIMLPGSNGLKIRGNEINIDISKLVEKTLLIHLEARESQGVDITGNSVKTVGNMMNKYSLGIMFYPSQWMVASQGIDIIFSGILSVNQNKIEANVAGIIFSVEPLRVHRNLLISTTNNRNDFGLMYFDSTGDWGSLLSIWINSYEVIFTENTCRTKIIYTPPAILRVIDEKTADGNAALKTGPRWDAQSFQSFWYDLDRGISGETLRIPQTNLGNEIIPGKTRIIKGKNDPGGACLIYRTERQFAEFKVHKYTGKNVENALDANGTKFPFGTHYGKLGWMGEDFVAIDGDISKVARLIIEQGPSSSEKKTLLVGDSWDIGEGWSLKAESIDAKATPRQAWFVLSKDGVKKDDKVIEQGQVYTYVEKSIAGKSDVPVFVTYVDSIFSGATTDMVQLRYTWAISTSVAEVRAGDIFGVFEVAEAGEKALKLENVHPIDLAAGSTIKLANDLVFKVAKDFDVLRFMPERLLTRPGTYDIRGYVLDEKTAPAELAVGFTWDFQSFQGFWYDLDSDLKSEILKIAQENLGDESTPGRSRIIKGKSTWQSGGLIYESTRQLVEFKVHRGVENALDTDGLKVLIGTHYAKLGWLTEEYVGLNGKANKISKLLMEQGRAALMEGETWNIGEGITLTAQSIDVKAHQVWLVLSYNGNKLEDKVVSEGEVYTYSEKSIAGENDVPMFVTYISTVFENATSGKVVEFGYTWAISRNVTEVKLGDIYGVFEVADANDMKVRLENHGDISLSSGSTITLAGKLKFKVANDENSLRFCLAVERTIESESSPAAMIDMAASDIIRRISVRTPGIMTASVAPLAETASTLTAASDTGAADAIEPSEIRKKVIMISAPKTIFSNNICTLDLPYKIQRDNRQGLAHVFLQSYNYFSANVMGNRCSEILKEMPIDDEDYIFSILAYSQVLYNLNYKGRETLSRMETTGKPYLFRMPSFLSRLNMPAKLEISAALTTEYSREAVILLGNITTNKIHPIPDPQNLNPRGW